MKEILLNLTKEQLIIIGVVLIILVVVSLIRKAIKLAVIIGLLALLVSTGGGVVNSLKDKYGIDIQGNTLVYRADNRAITINRDKIELKEDKGETVLVSVDYGGANIELEVPKIVYQIIKK